MKIKIQPQLEKKTLEEAFKEFIQYCEVKNLAEHTIIFYENCYKSFIKQFPQQGYINELRNTSVHKYILSLKDSISATAINSNLRGIRTYLYYCMKLGYLDKFNIELIKADKKIKQVYSDPELLLLLKKPDLKQCTFVEYRDWVIINYCLATGNRVSTIINIKAEDIDFTNGYITLTKTKNKRQQVVPLSQTLSSILSEFLTYRKGTSEEYLFCNCYGNQLAANALKHSIAKYNRSRGVMKTSIHLFRHTYAKKFIQAGGNVFQLQKLLGHSSLEIVKEYVNLFSDDLKLNYDRFNPLEQLVHNSSYIRMK